MRLPKLDPVLVLILAAVLLAVILPARGAWAGGVEVASTVAIGLLFFLYGARLSTSEALTGLLHWRLHTLILSFTYFVFPLLGVGLSLVSGPHGDIGRGLLYLTLVPSTVQSSVAFTSVARGNVAAAIVAASLSNLVGVVATPLLVWALLAPASGIHIDGGVFLDIALFLLAPFILGQLLRRWVVRLAQSPATKIVDRGSIALVVYSAFSAGMVQGVWASVTLRDLLLILGYTALLLAFMLWLTRWTAARLGLPLEDQIAIQFCGTKKSLATGLPMAAIIFGAGNVSLLILPLMIFHQIQLMVCAARAARYAAR